MSVPFVSKILQMEQFDFQPRTRVIFGAGSIARLDEIVRELNFQKTLLVADRGMIETGHVEEALAPLRRAGIRVSCFHDFEVNPDSKMVQAGMDYAAPFHVDSIIGLGGGSSLDCAKGINFLLTNGGEMRDYLGYGKAAKPLLPMIAVPTTAGTGSEAQSYALISDADSHQKMACGDPSAAFQVALLDPLLTLSQPRAVTATSGFDAIAHAVETYVTTRRNGLSDFFSREAWRLLDYNYERVLESPDDANARGAMQLGAYFAGMAIENSMLGATHACANPLTAHYGTVHGAALALLLPSVVRWNGEVVGQRYAELLHLSNRSSEDAPAETLARRLEELAAKADLKSTLKTAGVPVVDLPMLAEEAASQWTGTFNPRLFDLDGALEIYRRAF